jgi:hypothetical protein
MKKNNISCSFIFRIKFYDEDITSLHTMPLVRTIVLRNAADFEKC